MLLRREECRWPTGWVVGWLLGAAEQRDRPAFPQHIQRIRLPHLMLDTPYTPHIDGKLLQTLARRWATRLCMPKLCLERRTWCCPSEQVIMLRRIHSEASLKQHCGTSIPALEPANRLPYGRRESRECRAATAAAAAPDATFYFLYFTRALPPFPGSATRGALLSELNILCLFWCLNCGCAVAT